MAEIAGTSNFTSEIATLSISIFSNNGAKYIKKKKKTIARKNSKKIAKFIKK